MAKALLGKDVRPDDLPWVTGSIGPLGTIVIADAGSAANWYARNLRMRDGVRGSLSGTLATMGAAVPSADNA